MNKMISLICFIIAAVLFALATFGVTLTEDKKPNMMAAGLFFLTIALAIP